MNDLLTDHTELLKQFSDNDSFLVSHVAISNDLR